jgi:hypothetical protein
LSILTRFRRPWFLGRAAAEDGLADGDHPEGTPGNGALADGGAGEDGAVDPAGGSRGAAGGRRRVRTVAGWVTTALAGLLVLFALNAPSDLTLLRPGEFLRIPVEGILGVALLLALRARPRRVATVLAGVSLGVLTLLKLLDMGFLSVLTRPFDPVLDWAYLGAGVDFLTESVGRAGAIGAVVGAVLLTAGVLVVMTLAAQRLTRLVVRHNTTATRGVAVLAVVWATCAVLGAQIVPGEPIASRSTASLAYHHAVQVRTSMRDQEEFTRQAAVDTFHNTPPNELLTALRGKDVVVTFVESYGRVAVEDPEFAPQIGALLDDGNRRLAAAGFASKSAFLTSPVMGSGSWLAHATFLSGLQIDNQQRYRTLVSSDRQTLSHAFHSANWQTVSVMPDTTKAWPEGGFYGYDHVDDLTHMGYRGPNFSWSTMPDQYTLAQFERAEHAKRDRRPLMAEIDLTSSHAPWAPIPRFIPWNEVGDGSVFNTQSAPGDQPDAILQRDPARVRADYLHSTEYALNSLISYVETYGDDNLVMVFLGDHQPAPIVSGPGATRDVPITIVSKDRGVLDRISGWDWQDGLKPGPQAPVWPMSDFRDRFLTAFGPEAAKPR